MQCQIPTNIFLWHSLMTVKPLCEVKKNNQKPDLAFFHSYLIKSFRFEYVMVQSLAKKILKETKKSKKIPFYGTHNSAFFRMPNDAPDLIKPRLAVITVINQSDLISKYPGVLMFYNT